MKIDVNKMDDVQAALDELQSSVKVRTAQVGEVLSAADRAEAHLERFGIPKSKRRGARFNYIVGFGGKIPNSYNGRPESTMFVIERGTEKWFLVGYRRVVAFADTRITWTNLEHWNQAILDAAQMI